MVSRLSWISNPRLSVRSVVQGADDREDEEIRIRKLKGMNGYYSPVRATYHSCLNYIRLSRYYYSFILSIKTHCWAFGQGPREVTREWRVESGEYFLFDIIQLGLVHSFLTGNSRSFPPPAIYIIIFGTLLLYNIIALYRNGGSADCRYSSFFILFFFFKYYIINKKSELRNTRHEIK